MKLVSDWRDAWRWTSMHCMTLALAVQGTWGMLEPDLRATVPYWLVATITGVILVAGIVGRLRNQTGAKP